MISSAVVRLFRERGGPLDGEVTARMGIDFAPAPPAPGKKELLVEVHLVDGEALSNELIDSVGRCLQPLGMCGMHRLRVFDASAKVGIFSLSVPRNVDALN